MGSIKVGVVGVGHLGKIHASLYRQVQDCQLIGVHDINEERSREVAEELKVNAFKYYEELLNEADAVNIVTPTHTHFDLASRALQHGKHVFIEKPITRTLEEGQKLQSLAEQYHKHIQVGHIERFNPAILALQDVTIEPLFIEAHRLASFNARGTDVAVIFDLMIHDLDLIRHLVRSEPRHIAASGVNVVSSSEDIANARIEFKNGCVANITASRISAKKMRKMRLFQKNAYISMDFMEGFSEIFYIPKEHQQPFHDGTLAFSLGRIQEGEQYQEIKYNRLERENVNPLKEELRAFVEAILSDTDPPVTAQQGLQALELAQQVVEQIAKHKERLVKPESVSHS